jgi:hypothetical protein
MLGRRRASDRVADEEPMLNSAGLPVTVAHRGLLVMIEAMACGTPVIAFRCGSVPEVVEDGVTGFIVDDEEGAANAIKRLPELDRRHVRSAFERRFTARRMAEDYIGHYQRLAGNSSRSITSASQTGIRHDAVMGLARTQIARVRP